jgi:hypothetical protein
MALPRAIRCRSAIRGAARLIGLDVRSGSIPLESNDGHRARRHRRSAVLSTVGAQAMGVGDESPRHQLPLVVGDREAAQTKSSNGLHSLHVTPPVGW